MDLTVLGCGDAFGSGGRHNTSFLLSNGTRKILIDCGATTLVRLKQLKISVEAIDTVIITHFHGDHYGGLPFLLLSNHFEKQRKSLLTIIGPPRVESMVRNLQNALYPETSHILDELKLQFIEYKNAETMVHEAIEIYARNVTHSKPSNPYGIRLKWDAKAFGFSGDTEWNDSLIDLADQTDIFIIECNNLDTESLGHLSYQTVRTKAPLLNTKKLFLTHMGEDVIGDERISMGKLEDGLQISF